MNGSNKNLWMATFYMGIYTSMLDNDFSSEERDVIIQQLSEMQKKNSEMIEGLLQSAMKEVRTFANVKRYLNKLTEKEIRELNTYIIDIVNADGVISEPEAVFLQKEWFPYLRETLGDDDNAVLRIITGFTVSECARLLMKTRWTPSEATNNIKNLISATAGATEKKVIMSAIRKAGLYDKMCDGLSKLNTMRVDVKVVKGFIAESMQTTESTISRKTTNVLNNNGIADLEYIGKNGHCYYQHVKIGYKPRQIDFAKYKDQIVIVDKGNPYLKQLQLEGKKHGVKVTEGHITNQEAKQLAEQMQMETSITGKSTSSVVSTGVKAGKITTVSHEAGMQSMRTGAQNGFGFSLGSNLVDVLNGDKTVGDAAKDVVKDTATASAVNYTVGAAGTAIGSTSVGATVMGTVGSVGSAVTGTSVGGAVVGASSAATAAIGSVGSAAATTVVGTVGAVGSAAGSAAVAATAGTAIGGVVATGIGTATAGVAVVGAAAVAAAPIVAVGATLGFGFKILKSIFD